MSKYEDEYEKHEREVAWRVVKWISLGVISLLVLILFLGSWVTIGAGKRGILLRWGAVTGTVFGEGLHFKLPIVERVAKMDVQIQKEQVEATASSKDLQLVTSDIAVNFHVNPSSASSVYQQIGMDFKERILDPAVQESLKAVTAKFTAEQLITMREVVKDQVKSLLFSKVNARGLIIDEYNMVNFNFSKSFNDAIEAKVTAEQKSLAAKNKLEQVKFEAEQKIAEAKGKAEALRLESKAIEENPKVIELRMLEKWDGHYPQYVGGGMPLPVVNLQSNVNK